jgi:hypothetical protein
MISLFISRLSRAQDAEYDSLLSVYMRLDSIWLSEIENDSLSIFAIIDSMAAYKVRSQFTLRSSYNSQVYNSGRTYDIDQYGWSNGISYYHKSGIYLDLSGQYYSGIDPKYNATSLSIGYSDFITPKFGYGFNLSHAFYHELEESTVINNTLNNNIGISSYYSTKHLTLGLDYTYSFGSEGTTAHRVVPSLMITPSFSAKGFFKRFKFNPLVFATFGSETLYTEQYNNLVARNIIRKIGKERFLRNFQDEDKRLLNLIYDTETSNYFGPLNIEISLPLRYNHKNFSTTLSYNINLPIAIPEESLDDTINGYLGLSLYYRFSGK